MPEILNYTIKDISLSDIIMPAVELRTMINFEGLDELARSIRTVGLMNPITVRAIGDKYELIAGFRRTKACEIANVATISARVVNSSDDIADLQRLHENMFREDVNPIDEGVFFKKMMTKHNWRILDMAVQIHKSPSYVGKRVQLLDADPLIVQALKDQKINLSIADELNRIDEADARHRLLFYAINSGATVDIVRTWRIQYETDKTYVSPPPEQFTQVLDPTTGQMIPQATEVGKEPYPDMELKEEIIETRPCYACCQKTEIKQVRTLFVCVTCLAAIEAAIRPAENPGDDTPAESEIQKAGD